jgi:hypothetical protein
MSTENIAKLAEAAASNPTLSAKIQALRAESTPDFAERLADLSTEAGVPFTAEEYRAAYPGSDTELSAEQLERVAGGVRDSKNLRSPFEN